MVFVYQKQLIYSGTDWKIPVNITIPQTAISTATTTIYQPVAGYSVLNLTLINTNTSAVTINIYDGSTKLLSISVPAGGTTVFNNVVFQTAVVVSASSTGAYIFATGIDGYNPIE